MVFCFSENIFQKTVYLFHVTPFIYQTSKNRFDLKKVGERHFNKATMKNIIYIILFLVFSETIAQTDSTEKTPKWEFVVGMGFNLSHTLNINAPTNAPKTGFSTTEALDLTANYIKENSRFTAQNELHWTFSFYKSKANSASQNTADQVQTLHDFSYSIKKGGVWNFNLIAKAESQIFKLYEGNYLQDYEQLGQIQRFLNPYKYSLSPGIKYQPNKWLGISISPYSVQFFGLTDQKIADKGQFIEEQNPDGHYKKKVNEVLGAETNIWITKKFKKRAEINYRLNVSSNYFENILKNGKMGGTFITKINIIKNLSLSHRAILKGDLAQKPYKPYYNQVILLAYSLTL